MGYSIQKNQIDSQRYIVSMKDILTDKNDDVLCTMAYKERQLDICAHFYYISAHDRQSFEINSNSVEFIYLQINLKLFKWR